MKSTKWIFIFGSSLQVILMKWRRLQQMKFLGCDLFSKKGGDENGGDWSCRT